MTNDLQPAPSLAAKAAQFMLRSQSMTPDSPSTASQEKPKKKDNKFVIPSQNGKVILFNMLIINSLNRNKIRNQTKAGKTRRCVLHIFAFLRFLFIQHAYYQ
jgi:hypothetical protein